MNSCLTSRLFFFVGGANVTRNQHSSRLSPLQIRKLARSAAVLQLCFPAPGALATHELRKKKPPYTELTRTFSFVASHRTLKNCANIGFVFTAGADFAPTLSRG